MLIQGQGLGIKNDMKESGVWIFIGVLMIGLIIPYAYSTSLQNTVTCKEAVKNAYKIRVGMKKSEVLDLLGPPKIITDNRWSYTFDCVKVPPKAGETVITGLDIFFSDGAVKEIRLAWVDATGVRKPTT